jgi:hypothetical protein
MRVGNVVRIKLSRIGFQFGFYTEYIRSIVPVFGSDRGGIPSAEVAAENKRRGVWCGRREDRVWADS